MISKKTRTPDSAGTGRPQASKKPALCGVLALVLVMSLAACDSGKTAAKEVSATRPLPLAKVNDVEISLLQPASGSAPAGDPPLAMKEAVDKQLLETMIDRQLLKNEALRNKLDRDPQVILATERAKTQILAQAYLQSRFAAVNKPGKAEVDAYFHAHPELFTQRKTFYMKELIVATKDFSAPLKSRLDSARSINQVAAWLDRHHVRYERTELTRSTADFAPEMIAKLKTMRRHQIFVIKAGEHSMLDAIYDVKPSPVTAEMAVPQIENYLANRKREQISDVELGRLRASAKIEYLNNRRLASVPVPAPKSPGSPATIQVESGMAGFK